MGNCINDDRKEDVDAGKNHLVLLGDSTIDNLIWVDTFENSISSLLRKNLPELKITNLAAYGFSATDILSGCFPYNSYYERSQTLDKYPIKNKDCFFPLLELKKL